MRTILILIAAMAILQDLVPKAQAGMIEKCGTYRVQGFYTSGPTRPGNKTPILISDRNSSSSIAFFLADENGKKKTKDLSGKTHYARLANIPTGVNIDMNISISHKCNFQCDAHLVNVNGILKPYITPRQFLRIGLKPLPGSQTRCQD